MEKPEPSHTELGTPAKEEAEPAVTSAEAATGVGEGGNEVEEIKREEMDLDRSGIGDGTEKLNSSEDVIVAAQVDGSETLGDVRESDSIAEEQEKMDTGRIETEKEAVKCNEYPIAPNSCKDVNAAAQIDGSETLEDDIKDSILNDDDAGDARGEKIPEEDPQEDPEEVKNSRNNNGKDIKREELPVTVIDSVISDKKKDRSFELFIARLDTKTAEKDLVEVFGQFGEIKSVRVVRNKATNRSKRYAFLQYTTTKEAESAISAAERGLEVRGKRVNVSMSKDENNTIYLTNICREWNRELVLETFKKFGIENFDMRLPNDPHKPGSIRGYAFLEFYSHSDAISAFERLTKPDAIFGWTESAKVSFSRTPIHPYEDVLSQGKTVYLEGLTDDWTEAKVREFCEQHGVIQDLRLARTLRRRNRNYGYITFATRDDAHVCLKAFRSAFTGGMFKASIARLANCRPPRHELRGGYKVGKETEVPMAEEEGERENRDESSNVDGKENSYGEEIKATKIVPEAGSGDKSNENHNVRKNRRGQASFKLENFRGKRRDERRGRSDSRRDRRGRMPEKTQGENWRNQSTSRGKRKRDRSRDRHFRKSSHRNVDFSTYRNQYASEHGAPVARYEGHSYNSMSGSKRPHADMGRGRGYSGDYEPPFPMHYPPHAGTQYRPHVGHPQSQAGMYHYTHPSYENAPTQVGYVDPALGAHMQPHAGYLPPTAGNTSHNIGSGMQPTTPAVYGAGSSIPPSHPQHYPSHTGYEAVSSGGGYYQSSDVPAHSGYAVGSSGGGYYQSNEVPNQTGYEAASGAGGYYQSSEVTNQTGHEAAGSSGGTYYQSNQAQQPWPGTYQ